MAQVCMGVFMCAQFLEETNVYYLFPQELVGCTTYGQ